MNMMSTRPSPLPLTLGQMDFWEEFRAHPDQPVSTVAHLTCLDGALDADTLARAIAMMVEETDVLSLRFRAGDPPVQFVDPDHRPVLRRLDLRGRAEPEADARRAMRADISQPLDLCAGPLAATWLIRVGDTRWMWYLRGHHIFLDGYSMALIERRVAQTYAHLMHGAAAGRPFGRFADYLREEEAYRAGRGHRLARDYWREYLGNGPRPAILRKGAENYPAAPRSAEIALGYLSDPLQRAALRLDLGWPDLLTVLTALWLWHVPASDDPQDKGLVWLPLMGRMGSIAANIPAMVLNIAPYRVSPDPRARLTQTLAATQGNLNALRRHGRCRIEQIAADFGLTRDWRFFFSPLINVMPFGRAAFPGCDTAHEVLAAGPGDGFNATFSGNPRAEGLTLYLDADPALTSERRFAHHVAGLPGFLARCLRADADPILSDLLDGSWSENRSA